MRFVAALVASLVFAGTAHASPALDDPARWLQRIAEAAKQVNYHGEVIYRSGDRVEALEIVRRGAADGYLERLLTLDGVPREVVRDGKSVTCILPEGRASLEGHRVPRNPFPGEQWRYDEALTHHYDFLDLGEARIAGRSCQVIGIQPRDGYRYGYRLWVDSETGLLLRSDVIDADGEVVEQVAFTRVRLPRSLAADQLTPTLDGDRLHWSVRHEEVTGDRTWTIAGAPAGFTETTVRGRQGGTVQHVLSDGLATVSVFVAPTHDDRARLSGTSRMGAVSAFGTVVNGFQITVVGEVPLVTVQAIGESLTLSPPR